MPDPIKNRGKKQAVKPNMPPVTVTPRMEVDRRNSVDRMKSNMPTLVASPKTKKSIRDIKERNKKGYTLPKVNREDRIKKLRQREAAGDEGSSIELHNMGISSRIPESDASHLTAEAMLPWGKGLKYLHKYGKKLTKPAYNAIKKKIEKGLPYKSIAAAIEASYEVYNLSKSNDKNRNSVKVVKKQKL
jgi:hypothetical protein